MASSENHDVPSEKEFPLLLAAIKAFNGTVDTQKMADEMGLASAGAAQKRLKRYVDKLDTGIVLVGNRFGEAGEIAVRSPRKITKPKGDDDTAPTTPKTPKTPKRAARAPKRKASENDDANEDDNTNGVKDENAEEVSDENKKTAATPKAPKSPKVAKSPRVTKKARTTSPSKSPSKKTDEQELEADTEPSGETQVEVDQADAAVKTEDQQEAELEA